MSKLQQKIQAARRRGVYIFKMPAHLHRVRLAVEKVTHGRSTTRRVDIREKIWAVYVEGEWEPRYNMTKREAANLAYAISIAKKVELVVRYPHQYTLVGERE